jgi:pyocin large subunit-like protein
MNDPRRPTTEECQRPQGGRARYDRVTQEYGSVRADGTIATYFRPDPAIHGYVSNLDYFLAKCR